jgi:hypothetical protein
MRRKDYIALGLTAAVLLGVGMTRKPAEAKTAPAPTPTVDPAVQQARVLIQTLEAQAANATPQQREAIAQQLDSTANAVAATSPQAASELHAAATRIRGGGAPTPVPPLPTPTPIPIPPPPAPTPVDQNVQAARTLISTLETQINLSPPEQRQAQRQAAATQLENAALAVEATSPQAAAEMRAAAQRFRGGVAPPPGTGANPGPVTTSNILDRFEALRARAEQYLNDQTASIPMDMSTLGAMDRTARELAESAPFNPQNAARAETMVGLASRSYQKRGLQRPIAFTL